MVDFRQALRRAARGEDQAPAQAEAPSTPSVSLFYKRSKWPEAVAAFNRDNILALFNGKRSQPEKRLARLVRDKIADYVVQLDTELYQR